MTRATLITFLCVAMIAAVHEASAAYADVYGMISTSKVGRNGTDAFLVVDGGARITVVDATGHFLIGHLQSGSHAVEVRCGDLIFPYIRIDVSDRADHRYRAVINDGSGRLLLNAYSDAAYRQAVEAGDGEQPLLLLEPSSKHNYFVPREGFSILGFLKNPMMLMMLVSMGMMYVLPMVADQDEMKAQLKEAQRSTAAKPQQQQTLQNRQSGGAAKKNQ